MSDEYYSGRYCEIISNKIVVHQIVSKSFALYCNYCYDYCCNVYYYNGCTKIFFWHWSSGQRTWKNKTKEENKKEKATGYYTIYLCQYATDSIIWTSEFESIRNKSLTVQNCIISFFVVKLLYILKCQCIVVAYLFVSSSKK